jgi:hypothetical protein
VRLIPPDVAVRCCHDPWRVVAMPGRHVAAGKGKRIGTLARFRAWF